MSTTRRNFLSLAASSLAMASCSGLRPKAGATTTSSSGPVSSAPAGSANGAGASPSSTSSRAASGTSSRPGRPLKLLILGGTGFIGPAIVEVARAHGHAITLFNRGKTRPELFSDLEKLHGDRDPDKGEGIKVLEGRKWDAVIDDSGYFPRMVKASAELLAPNVGHYVYVSSVSVYASEKTENEDESAAVGVMADPTVETMGAQYENYGPLKALCEQAVEKALPGRTTVVRPGYIVGPGDHTDRFTYWPVRAARGGEMLAPGKPTDPLQIIDVRDLAEWLVLLVEQNSIGVFNAIGPEKRNTMGETLEACKAAAGSDVRFTWVSADFLEKQSSSGEIDLPIWAPHQGETVGFHTRSNARAIKAGLRFRPVPTTVRDTLEYFRSLPPERQAKLRAGLTPEREVALLAAWHAEHPGG